MSNLLSEYNNSMTLHTKKKKKEEKRRKKNNLLDNRKISRQEEISYFSKT